MAFRALILPALGYATTMQALLVWNPHVLRRTLFLALTLSTKFRIMVAACWVCGIR